MSAILAFPAPVQSADPILETDFVKEMVRQMRALDSYGQYDGKPAASLLAPLLLTKARKAVRDGGVAWIDRIVRHDNDAGRFDRMAEEGWRE